VGRAKGNAKVKRNNQKKDKARKLTAYNKARTKLKETFGGNQ